MRSVVIDQALIDLVGSIYDATLDPAAWHDALDRVREHFGLFNAAIGISRLAHEPVSIAAVVNFPENYHSLLTPEYNDDVVRLWGGREIVERVPIEEPLTFSQVTDRRALPKNLYYRDFVEPQGLVDSVAVVLNRDRRQVASVSFGSHRDKGLITEDIVAGMRFLAPHFRRAALISGILEEERKQRMLFEAVVDAIRSAIVLVDRFARIVHANPAAQAVIDSGDPLRSEQGKLATRGEVVPGHLLSAIAAAADGDIPLGRRGIVIPGTRSDGTHFVAHVMPLLDRKARDSIPGEAVAAVFLADRDDEPRLVVDAATLIYTLTPAEACLLELMLEGCSNEEMAHRMGIASTTLKWHTQGLYEKTGQHRRSDVERLVSKLGPAG